MGMKSMEPTMKLPGQVRKATEQIAQACLAEEFEKAKYILALITQMCESFNAGIPVPWREYAPMVDEEFE
jgi:hypothetical protein